MRFVSGHRVSLLALALTAACSAPAAPPPTRAAPTPRPGPARIDDEAGAMANAGKRVGVTGIARDAKLAAVIETDHRLVVYCLGVEAWPGDIAGRPVTAFGRLEHSHAFEAPPEAPDEASQGTSGPVWVLHDCRYGE